MAVTNMAIGKAGICMNLCGDPTGNESCEKRWQHGMPTCSFMSTLTRARPRWQFSAGQAYEAFGAKDWGDKTIPRETWMLNNGFTLAGVFFPLYCFAGFCSVVQILLLLRLLYVVQLSCFPFALAFALSLGPGSPPMVARYFVLFFEVFVFFGGVPFPNPPLLVRWPAVPFIRMWWLAILVIH